MSDVRVKYMIKGHANASELATYMLCHVAITFVMEKQIDDVIRFNIICATIKSFHDLTNFMQKLDLT